MILIKKKYRWKALEKRWKFLIENFWEIKGKLNWKKKTSVCVYIIDTKYILKVLSLKVSYKKQVCVCIIAS